VTALNITKTKYPKQRLIVAELKKFIDITGNRASPIAIMAGIRRIGKTTVLHCLMERYDSVYIDFRNNEVITSPSDAAFAGKSAEAALEFFVKKPNNRLLLLDEVTYLKNYETLCGDLYNMSGGGIEWKFKTIITGSSPAHLFKLAHTTLGGGRSKIYNLPVLSFIEYLYFTGRIQAYSAYDDVTMEDFRNYLSLKNLMPELSLTFDEQYFTDYYETNADSNSNSCVGKSLTKLITDDLKNMAKLLAYQLSGNPTYDTVLRPDIGRQELKPLLDKDEQKKLSFSNTLISKGSYAIRTLTQESRARLLRFLIESRIVTVVTTLYSEFDRKMDAREVIRELESTDSHAQLEDLFSKVSIQMCSPLLYSRLGDDVLKNVGLDLDWVLSDKLYNELLGKMLEIYIRGALNQYDCAIIPYTSMIIKYSEIGEVDIWDDERGILCEVTAGKNKGSQEVRLHKYFKDMPLIRICTTQRHEDIIEGFLRIPYPKLCCMIDTGDILTLEKTVIV
jgi:hypothetical protein